MPNVRRAVRLVVRHQIAQPIQWRNIRGAVHRQFEGPLAARQRVGDDSRRQRHDAANRNPSAPGSTARTQSRPYSVPDTAAARAGSSPPTASAPSSTVSRLRACCGRRRSSQRGPRVPKRRGFIQEMLVRQIHGLVTLRCRIPLHRDRQSLFRSAFAHRREIQRHAFFRAVFVLQFPAGHRLQRRQAPDTLSGSSGTRPRATIPSTFRFRSRRSPRASPPCPLPCFSAYWVRRWPPEFVSSGLG